jgi:4-amino-4-deoxy-L-arabinose transferase-like glycosyltransferase
MTKNIVAFFPLVPMAIYMLPQRDLSFLKDKRFWYGVLLAALIILPWHIYQSLVAGKAFWNEYFVYHVLHRYSSVIATNGHPFWYFIDLIFLRYKEDLVVFGGSVLVSVYLSWKSKAVRYLLISTLTLLLIFSLSTTKLPGYIAMVLPLLVMLSGLSLTQLINWIPRIWLKISVTVILSVTLVYTGFQFNHFKVIKSESEFEYLDSKEVGLFLKGYHSELPIYLNTPLNKNLVIAYYSNRPLLEIQTDLPGVDTKQETKEVILRTGTKLVLLGQNYILVLR